MPSTPGTLTFEGGGRFLGLVLKRLGVRDSAEIYAGAGFAPFKDALAPYQAAAPERLAHPYFAEARPETLLIEEVEALWEPIAQLDDWKPLYAKLDAITRAGATVIGSFSLRVSDEPGARRAVLEAAGRDARAKAETLAQATGKQVGDPVSITEDIIACNGAYAALRSAAPFAIGAASPPIAGELEYYARVTANFRLQ